MAAKTEAAKETVKETLSLFAKLLEVRKAVPYLKKEANGGGLKFSYNSSSQVLGAVRQKLDELGLLLITKILDKRVHAREKLKKDGMSTVTYEVELDLEFTWVNVENPTETLVINWFSMGLDTGDNAKSVGKALTYGEKYFLLKEFNIATDNDDPDIFQEKSENNVVELAGEESMKQFNEKAQEFANLRGQDLKAVYKALSIKNVEKLTDKEVGAHIDTLTVWIIKAQQRAEKEAAAKKQAEEQKQRDAQKKKDGKELQTQG